jgi:putative transposase
VPSYCSRFSSSGAFHIGRYRTHCISIDTKRKQNLSARHRQHGFVAKARRWKNWASVVEQGHRAIKRVVKPMMGFKDFRCARIVLSGIEGQMKTVKETARSAAEQFYSLVI